jgi:hypothetical protein
MFEIGRKLLPAASKPYHDELLSSWIARLAFNHGIKYLDFFSILLEKKSNYNINVDFLSYDDLRLLASLTNCSFAEVISTSLHFYENSFFESVSQPQQVLTAWTFQRFSKDNGQNNIGLMFCAKCLSSRSKPVYFRKQWRLGISFVCSDCECYLNEACPHCGNVISFFKPHFDNDYKITISDYLRTCRYCQGHISQCKTIPAPKDLVAVQSHLYKILEHSYPGRGVYPISYFKVLRRISSLFSLLDYEHVAMIPNDKGLDNFVLDVLAAHKHSLPSLHKEMANKEIQKSEVFKRAFKIMLAHWLLEEWPTRFLYYCKRFNLNRSHVWLKCFEAPFWFWEPVYSALAPQLPQLGPVPFGLRKMFPQTPIRRKKWKRKKNALRVEKPSSSK